MPAADKLAQQFFAAGLIQFGRFKSEDGRFIPMHISMHLLPSYPQLLHDVAESLLPWCAGAERLLCGADSLALGVALGQISQIPLVHSLGTGGPASSDLVGAYDVGHPALLIANTGLDADRLMALARKAATVGLNVSRICALVGINTAFETTDIPTVTLFDLQVLTEIAIAGGFAPPYMGVLVEQWIARAREKT